MNPLTLGAAILCLLAWAGRRPGRVRAPLRVFRLATVFFRRRMTAVRRSAASMIEPRGGELSEADARAILGVDAGARRTDIDWAYRRLIRLAHPDHGGTVGLAAHLNAARDRLIKSRAYRYPPT